MKFVGIPSVSSAAMTQRRESAHLEAKVNVVGDANHFVVFQRVLAEALHCHVVQQRHRQLRPLFQFHSRCEVASTCTANGKRWAALLLPRNCQKAKN